MSDYRAQIGKVLAGNKQAFAEIVTMFQGMARAVAERRLGDPSLAEDAVQEAFLTAYAELSRLRNPDAFPGWFRTILSRCCSRILRQRRAEAMGLDEESIPAGEDTDPYRLYTRRLDRDMVRRILASLPGVAREACIQRYVLGLPYDYIAKLLKVPVGTVKRRLYTARQQILDEVRARRGRAIRVGYLPISDHLLAMVSHARHGGPASGIVLKRYLSWSGLARDLVAGLVDGAFIMATLAMSLRNKGVPLVYVLDGHHDGSAITVRRDMPSGKLAGVRMGLPHAVSTQRMYLHGLMGIGAGPEAILPQARFISPSYLGRYFMGREIDGFFCEEPWHTKSEAEGLGRVLARSSDFAPGHICCGLAVREPFAAQSGQLLHDYVAGVLAAADYAAGHPGDCADIQARYTGVDHGVAEHVLRKGYVTFRDLAPDRGRLEQSMRLAVRSAVLDRPCDLGGFVRPEYA